MDADRDSGTPTVWRFLARKLHYGRGTDADRAQLHAISVCTFIFLFHFAICDLQLTIFFWFLYTLFVIVIEIIFCLFLRLWLKSIFFFDCDWNNFFYTFCDFLSTFFFWDFLSHTVISVLFFINFTMNFVILYKFFVISYTEFFLYTETADFIHWICNILQCKFYVNFFLWFHTLFVFVILWFVIAFPAISLRSYFLRIFDLYKFIDHV